MHCIWKPQFQFPAQYGPRSSTGCCPKCGRETGVRQTETLEPTCSCFVENPPCSHHFFLFSPAFYSYSYSLFTTKLKTPWKSSLYNQDWFSFALFFCCCYQPIRHFSTVMALHDPISDVHTSEFFSDYTHNILLTYQQYLIIFLNHRTS